MILRGFSALVLDTFEESKRIRGLGEEPMKDETSSVIGTRRKSSMMATGAALAAALFAMPAIAEEPAAPAAPPVADSGAAKPKPPPYSLPWMMRPVTAGNVIRLDTTFARSKPTNTTPIMLLASYKVKPNLVAIVRLGVIHNEPQTGTVAKATSFINPALGVLYSVPIGKSVKAGLFGAVTIPVGTGGGNDPDLPKRTADIAGIFARASMDNALFQVNYMTPIVGAGLAYISDALTLQAEATLLQLIRVRGDQVDKDSARTNTMLAAHLGWFVAPYLSFGAELHYQYWISHPTIEKDIADKKPGASERKDNWTVGFGPRAHIKLNEKMWLRPGVQLTMGLDLPTGFTQGGSEYKIVQVDIPFIF